MGYIARNKFCGFSIDGTRTLRKGGGGGPSPEESAAAASELRQKNIREAQAVVDKYFTPASDGDPFSDGWYSRQRQAYSNYYLPDLEKQYKDARQQLEMNLAQTNPYGSSTNVTSLQRLEDEYKKQYSTINQNADNFTSDLRTQMADARTKAMANAGEVSLATTAQQAADAASSAANVAAFSPLGQLFANMVTPTVTGLSSVATNANAGTTSSSGGVTNFNSGGKSSVKNYW